MKKVLLSIAALLAMTLVQAQHRADQQHLSDPASSSMIILGDPQGYIKYDLNQGIFEITTGWIADNVKNLNIKAVLCTGDLVEQNDNNALNRNMLNQTSREMWEAVSHAFKRIDNKVPYMICGGNHDYGFKSSEDYHTFYPEYFNFDRQKDAIRDILVSEHPNRCGQASLENSAYEIVLPGWSHKFMVVSTEFTPSDGTLEWIKKLCEKYPEHYFIYLTHSYIYDQGRRNSGIATTEKYNISKMPGNNSGEDTWKKLISQVPNIRLVVCGHFGHAAKKGEPDNYEDNVGWRIDKNTSGKNVYSMMFNIQTLGGGWEGNGGDGWVRILEFMPDGKTVKVKTYSTLFGISPLTKHLAHRTGPYDEFSFTIE